jgi:cystathionine beta-lyase/cystathionine gamma-synthase
MRDAGIDTTLAQAGSRWDEKTGAISMPVYHSATFRHPALGESTGFDYSRSCNPTRLALEQTMATLDRGCRAFAFSSGLAAIDAVLYLFGNGDSVALTEDPYGGTYRLFESVYKPFGITTFSVDTSDIREVERALQQGVRAVFVESPTNPLLRLADIRGISELARAHGALTIVDNTLFTPVMQRPLELGADLVVYSATKYLSGHNDVVAGIVVAGTEELAERIGFIQNAVGAVLGPQDSWLVIRGLKTLSVRMERQQRNALAIARWLNSHPRVSKVYYPGLSEVSPHCGVSWQSGGCGAIISFEVSEPELASRILSGVKVFMFAESLGGVESLITYPVAQTHSAMPAGTLERLGINDRLLRLSVGIEDLEDLIDDLKGVLGDR